MASGRRGQYISTSELDEKIFALMEKRNVSESAVVKDALHKYFNLVNKLNQLTHDPTPKK